MDLADDGSGNGNPDQNFQDGKEKGSHGPSLDRYNGSDGTDGNIQDTCKKNNKTGD
jgi:hypothetical protein